MIDNEIDFSLYGVLNKKFKPLSKYSFLNLKYVLIAFFTITILLFNAPYIYIFIFTSNYSYKLSISIHQKNPFPYTYHQFFNSSFNQLIVNSGILLSIKASSPFISTALSIIFEYTNKHAANGSFTLSCNLSRREPLMNISAYNDRMSPKYISIRKEYFKITF